MDLTVTFCVFSYVEVIFFCPCFSSPLVPLLFSTIRCVNSLFKKLVQCLGITLIRRLNEAVLLFIWKQNGFQIAKAMLYTEHYMQQLCLHMIATTDQQLPSYE